MSFVVGAVVGIVVAVGALWVVGAAVFALYDWATALRTPRSPIETDDEIDHRYY